MIQIPFFYFLLFFSLWWKAIFVDGLWTSRNVSPVSQIFAGSFIHVSPIQPYPPAAATVAKKAEIEGRRRNFHGAM